MLALTRSPERPRAGWPRLFLAALLLCACRAAPAEPPDARPAPEETAATFAGLWDTTYGRMRLAGDETRVQGTYSYSGVSQIAGDVAGRVLRATYTEPDGTQGRAVLELAPDGARFDGVWRAGLDPGLELASPDASAWTGTRVEPVPGRTWLVILEAHWEESLAEHEYSYGDMLRAFFERVPAVEVRHRFFHDQADLVRYARELADLAEPVVLYISSHGDARGIAAGGNSIDGATLGAALCGLDHLKLLHLGACELLAGSFAADVRAAAGADFPISGFTVDVDWAGSAIVDFTYLHLVLEQGLEPAPAARAVRSMLTFAGEAGSSKGPIGGCDLTVLGED
jgi:hypothetical protein